MPQTLNSVAIDSESEHMHTERTLYEQNRFPSVFVFVLTVSAVYASIRD